MATAAYELQTSSWHRAAMASSSLRCFCFHSFGIARCSGSSLPATRRGGAMASQGDCPVCLNSFGVATRTEGSKVRFPCGHVVCKICDSRMQQRNFHSCPLCRTPREGFTHDDVNRASRARALGDAERDSGHAPFFRLTLESGGPSAFQRFGESQGYGASAQTVSSWSVILLPNQATGDPFRVLRTNVAIDAAVGAVDHQQAEEEAAEEEVPAGRPGRGGAAALVGQQMQEFIRSQLLQPTSMPQFLEAHRQLRR